MFRTSFVDRNFSGIDGFLLGSFVISLSRWLRSGVASSSDPARNSARWDIRVR